jgi:hypothetical protein
MIYFITENYLKNNTAISSNCDVKYILPFVQTNADMWVQPVLGSFFYEDLLTKYNAQTLSPEETNLVKKIQPLIAWRAAADAVYSLSRKVTNKGVQRQDGEFSGSVELNELSFSMAHYNQKAEFYTARLVNYLKENKDDFPNFTSKQNKDSDIKPNEDKSQGYNSSFTFI